MRTLPLSPYAEVWQRMRAWAEGFRPGEPDQWWFLQHEPVFTLGLNGDASHLLGNPGIPLLHSDRGGHITYHGPGQLIVYFLMDLRRLKLGVKQLVCDLEQGVLGLLQEYGIDACRRPGAPGVYTQDGKIAALGLRVKNGCCYHGISLNVDMDLSPFRFINPCGYQGLAVTQMKNLVDQPLDIQRIGGQLAARYLSLWRHAVVGEQPGAS